MDKVSFPVIGKDVIESLTLGMYDDSKFIYREYIQNSADQIDKSIREGLLEIGEGEIHISIDAHKKLISIEDNATGVSEKEIMPILQNIAQSTKQRGVDKGFRGIGRLGGLAYCEKLIFETSFKGEAVKSIMTWDAKLLKEIINNRHQKEEAANVVSEVTKVSFSKHDAESHYFKVTLSGVSNDDLLDVKEIRNYLSMVAPVAFSNKFIFKSEIYERLHSEGLSIDEYKIHVNTEQLYKGYSTYIYKGEESKREKVGEVIGVEFFKDFDHKKNILFWGWYSLTTSLNEQMKSINKARGFRLRKGNIQIGDEYTLERFHREQRGNFYYFGEVYAFHPDLIPNSRRDYFLENTCCLEFEKKLRPHFYKLKDLYYVASSASSASKKIEEFESAQKEFFEKANTSGFIDKAEQKTEFEKLESKKQQAIVAQKDIEKLSIKHKDDKAFNKIIEKVTENKPLTVLPIVVEQDLKPKYRTDRLTSLSKDQRKFLSKIFSIIRDVLDETTAEELISKVEEELR